MDVRIGILHSPRELTFETSQTAEEIEKLVSDAITVGGGPVVFEDDKGRRFLVPASGIAFVELGGDQSRRVGFVA